MIKELDPREISFWELNPRKRVDAKSLEHLMDSMRSVGWLGVVMVRLLDDGCHQVVWGERRVRAAVAVGLQKITVEVRELTDREAIELAVIENRDRVDLDVIEEAHGYRSMVQLGWTVKEISQRSGRAEQMVFRFIELCDMPADVQGELRDGVITMSTARLLWKIEDEKKQKEALERVARPIVQDRPLSERMAAELIQQDYLEPQKRQVAWAKREKTLAREYPGAVIASVVNADEYAGWASGWVRADGRVPKWELAVHARQWEDELVPTWGELAVKHGGPRAVVPDEDGEPLLYVLAEPLRVAERVLGEADPRNCIFPLTGRTERHEQSLQAQLIFRQQEADAAKEAEEIAKRVRAVLDGLRERTAGGYAADAVVREVVRLAAELYDEAVEDAAFDLGIDVKAMGGGDAAAGVREWVELMLEVDALGGMIYLLGAVAITGCEKWHESYVPRLERLERVLAD
jgi:ParB/RepB/Spo0J family partition protein